MDTCAASGFMSLSCSSSPVASSYWCDMRERRKRDELARESLNERKSSVRERVVGVVVDDEAIAESVASSARSGVMQALTQSPSRSVKARYVCGGCWDSVCCHVGVPVSASRRGFRVPSRP